MSSAPIDRQMRARSPYFTALSIRLQKPRRSATGWPPNEHGFRCPRARSSARRPASPRRCFAAGRRDRASRRGSGLASSRAKLSVDWIMVSMSARSASIRACCSASSMNSARRRSRVIGVRRSWEMAAIMRVRSSMKRWIRSCMLLKARIALRTSDAPRSARRRRIDVATKPLGRLRQGAQRRRQPPDAEHRQRDDRDQHDRDQGDRLMRPGRHGRLVGGGEIEPGRIGQLQRDDEGRPRQLLLERLPQRAPQLLGAVAEQRVDDIGADRQLERGIDVVRPGCCADPDSPAGRRSRRSAAGSSCCRDRWHRPRCSAPR